MTPFLEMRDITKRFPGVLANDGVSLTVERGEIHSLLGENGAGKSTLMQVLYGLHRPDAGEVRLDGAPVAFAGPAEAIAKGIGMIHQEFMLVRPLTVAENVVLGLKSGGPMLHLRTAARRIGELSEAHGLAVSPNARVKDLPIGVQQRVEILKLLFREARLLILDEPTAVLTPQEKDGLFAVLRRLAQEGRSVVIVTHKLHEVMDISHRVTVMRDGRVTACVKTAETSERELARLMVGRDVMLKVEKGLPRPSAAPVLRVESLSVRDPAGRQVLAGVDLTVHAGEILGIAGVDGNGQSELAEAVLGLQPAEAGTIALGETSLSALTTAERRARGLAYVPADRRRVGSVAEMSVADNAVLGGQWEHTRLAGLLRDEKRQCAHAGELVRRFGVRTVGTSFAAGKLSGGNLQKLILGREIMRAPAALVIEQPTRGLDVGAIETVWAELLAQRAAGVAILLISAEMEEILNLADRIAVMFAGRVMGILDRAEADPETIGLMMAGAPLDSIRQANPPPAAPAALLPLPLAHPLLHALH